MCYYIDGLNIPFTSFQDIRAFVLSLHQSNVLYMMIDRSIYYGDVQENRYIRCAVLNVQHHELPSKTGYDVSVICCYDACTYSSWPEGFARYFKASTPKGSKDF